MSSNIGEQIQKIVKESNNETWKVNFSELISENDALSRDIMYYKSCITAEWQKWKLKTSQNPSKSIENDLKNPKDLKFLAAQIQFHSQLQEKNRQYSRGSSSTNRFLFGFIDLQITRSHL